MMNHQSGFCAFLFKGKMKFKDGIQNEISLRFITGFPKIITEKGCWIPKQYLNNGYGMIAVKGKRIYLHRVSAIVYLGLDKDNKEIQVNHKPECNNRACFNPEHLYIGTQTENYRDLITTKTHRNLAKKVCPKCGEAYRKESRGSRYCRSCKNKKQNERYNAKN